MTTNPIAFSKPFSLEHAKAGARFILRNGTKVRILCWDRKGQGCPLVGLATRDYDVSEIVYAWTIQGSIQLGKLSSDWDLVMAPMAIIDGRPVFVGDVIEATNSGLGYQKITVLPSWLYNPLNTYRWPAHYMFKDKELTEESELWYKEVGCIPVKIRAGVSPGIRSHFERIIDSKGSWDHLYFWEEPITEVFFKCVSVVPDSILWYKETLSSKPILVTAGALAGVSGNTTHLNRLARNRVWENYYFWIKPKEKKEVWQAKVRSMVNPEKIIFTANTFPSKVDCEQKWGGNSSRFIEAVLISTYEE